MFTNITDPGSIVMAGNPVIFTGHTDITANSFPTILATFQCYHLVQGSYAALYKEDYTYPLGRDGNFQFDLSEALSEAFRQHTLLTTAPSSTVPSGSATGSSSTVPSGSATGSSATGSTPPIHTPSPLIYTLTLTEQYFLDGNLYTGSSVIKGSVSGSSASGSSEGGAAAPSPSSDTFFAIPGHLTDTERNLMPTDNISTLLSPARVLSRKPLTDDITVQGAYFIYPYITITNGLPKISYSRSLRNAVGKQSQPAGDTGLSRQTYVTEPDATLFPIIFWNRFGLLESVTAKAIPVIQHNLQSTQYAVQQQQSFRSVAQQRSHTDHEPMLIALSSGIVSREWYEWWISEVLTTPNLYVLLNNYWYAATIIPDNAIKFDLAKPAALSVEFTIKLSVSGSIHNSFV